MKIKFIIIASLTLLLTGCANEYNRVLKSTDLDYRYEYAKQCFAEGQFNHAEMLLQDGDYERAAATFRKYFQSYPRGVYAERAMFYVGQALYQSAPEPRLDQTPTIGAINAYQQFLDFFPSSELYSTAQDRLFELQDKLVMKELLSAQLYYNLGGYFGNVSASTESNYASCIIVAQNALKNYPYMKWREEFTALIMKSKFELAENSTEDKRLERYRDAEDECYGFINEFPDSKEVATAEKLIAKCKKVVKD